MKNFNLIKFTEFSGLPIHLDSHNNFTAYFPVAFSLLVSPVWFALWFLMTGAFEGHYELLVCSKQRFVCCNYPHTVGYVTLSCPGVFIYPIQGGNVYTHIPICIHILYVFVYKRPNSNDTRM